MASLVDSFWLQEKSPLQQTYEKHPTKFHIKNSQNIQKGENRPLTKEDVQLIGLLCFEGGLKVDQSSISFNTERQIVILPKNSCSPKNSWSPLYEDLPHYKQTSMFIRAMKTTNELSLSEIATTEVKKALRKIQKEKFYEIRGILDSHFLFPLASFSLFTLTTIPWYDPTFISAAGMIGALSVIQSSVHFVLGQKASNAFNEYLIPKVDS